MGIVTPGPVWTVALVATVSLLLVLGCGSQTVVNQSATPVGVPRETTLVIGVTVPNVEEDQDAFEEFQPLSDYLAARLGQLGIQEGRVLLARSPVEMAKFMRQGKVDLYLDPTFASVIVNQLSGSEPILSRWKKGVEKYHSVIFVSSSEGINSLDDLLGKTIAFEDPGSTSAYFLPKAELLRRGYTLSEKQGPTDPVAPEEIGHYFSMSDRQLVADVVTGTAAAGGQQEAEIMEYLDGAGQADDAAEVLLTTANIFRSMVSVRSGLDPRLRAGLKEVLLAMDDVPEGLPVLETLSKTARFGDFGENSHAVFQDLQDLADLVEKEIVQR